MVYPQELAEVHYILGVDFLRGHNATRACEVLIELVVQLFAVCHENKCPVAGALSQYLLGKENH